MKTKDVCLWPQHKESQKEVAHLFPNGGTVKVTFGGKTSPVTFIPMNGAQGLKPSKEAEGYSFWKSIPYGSEVVIE